MSPYHHLNIPPEPRSQFCTSHVSSAVPPAQFSLCSMRRRFRQYSVPIMGESVNASIQRSHARTMRRVITHRLLCNQRAGTTSRDPMRTCTTCAAEARWRSPMWHPRTSPQVCSSNVLSPSLPRAPIRFPMQVRSRRYPCFPQRPPSARSG